MRYRAQRGVYSIVTVFVILMAISALGVLAVGQLAWQRGEVQSLADMVALTAARQLADGPQFTQAREIAQENGLQQGDLLQIQCLIDGAPSENCDQAITARVTITRGLSPLFSFLGQRIVTAVSEATTAPTVAGTVSSGLVSLDSNQSALLNGLLSTLGGGSVNLSVAQYGALLGSQISVNLLNLATELGAGSINDLLDLHVSALTLLQDALIVGNADAADALPVSGALSALSGPLNAVNLKVGDLLAVDLSGRSNTVLNVDLGSLAQVALLKSVESQSYTVPLHVGILNLDVTATILQAPQIFVGRKSPYKDPITSAKTAQVGLDVRIQQPLGMISLPGLSLSALDMRLQLRVAGGLLDVNQLTCRYPRANDNLQMTVVPALTEVCIAESSSNLNTTTGSLSCGAPANILQANLLGINATVKLAAQTSLRGDPTQFSVDGVAPFSKSINLSLADTLGSALENTSLNLTIDLPVLGPLLSTTVNALANTLISTLDPVLRPILYSVGTVLDSLLQALGVNLNTVTVNVDSIDCKSVVLTK